MAGATNAVRPRLTGSMLALCLTRPEPDEGKQLAPTTEFQRCARLGASAPTYACARNPAVA